MKCEAPENVELSLHEFWCLSSLPKHKNVVNFHECILDVNSEMSVLKHGDKSSAYLSLIETSIKG